MGLSGSIVRLKGVLGQDDADERFVGQEGGGVLGGNAGGEAHRLL